jgi:hypothetical protein
MHQCNHLLAFEIELVHDQKDFLVTAGRMTGLDWDEIEYEIFTFSACVLTRTTANMS